MGTQERAESRNQPSVLAQLRALVPREPLRYTEALRIAEQQTNLLLRIAQVKEPPLPTDLIACLPPVTVVAETRVPVAGSAHWSGSTWVIVLNAGDSAAKQRLALAHELKHIIDHTTRSFLYRGMPGMTAAEQAERAADYFAGCLLMPTRWLKAAWASDCRTAAQFARRFGAPASTAKARLVQVGLAPPETPGSETDYAAPRGKEETE